MAFFTASYHLVIKFYQTKITKCFIHSILIYPQRMGLRATELLANQVFKFEFRARIAIVHIWNITKKRSIFKIYWLCLIYTGSKYFFMGMWINKSENVSLIALWYKWMMILFMVFCLYTTLTLMKITFIAEICSFSYLQIFFTPITKESIIEKSLNCTLSF